MCQQPALPGGSASLADVQKHPLTPPPLLPLSWSIFLFCLWAHRTQRPFKTAIETRILSCSNHEQYIYFWLFHSANTLWVYCWFIDPKATCCIVCFLFLHYNCWSVYFLHMGKTKCAYLITPSSKFQCQLQDYKLILNLIRARNFKWEEPTVVEFYLEQNLASCVPLCAIHRPGLRWSFHVYLQIRKIFVTFLLSPIFSSILTYLNSFVLQMLK